MGTESKSANQSEEAHNEFLRWFALTVLAWQFNEQQLFMIFWQLFGAEQYRVLSAAFHSVINLNARLEMTDQTAAVVLKDHPQLLAEWNTLSKRIGRLAKRRNQMAHATLFGHGPGAAPKSSIPPETTYLRPSPMNVLADQDDEFDLKRIKTTKESFDALGYDMILFSNRLWKVIQHFPKDFGHH